MSTIDTMDRAAYEAFGAARRAHDKVKSVGVWSDDTWRELCDAEAEIVGAINFIQSIRPQRLRIADAAE